VQTLSREDGFTLVELMTSSVLTLLLLAGAVTTFQNALSLNTAGQQIADSSQNLRSGANLLIHDLMQAGRKIPTGGIPIPNGAGATPINRPSPPGGPVYTFDNVANPNLMTVISGSQMGPVVGSSTTDMITFLMIDPLLGDTNFCDSALTVPANTATIQSDGSYITVAGTTSTTGFNWLVGDPVNGIPPVRAGDIIWFNTGGTAIRTVTSVDASRIYFANGDWFNFNQVAAAQGTLTSLRSGSPLRFPCGFAASRLMMYTYYVDSVTTPGIPRLTRVINNFPPQALAGVVEDLDITYDLVDGTINPVLVNQLPFTDPGTGIEYSASLIRKVNLHIGVRSDVKSEQTRDYVRGHVNTVVSLRNLAFVARYR